MRCGVHPRPPIWGEVASLAVCCRYGPFGELIRATGPMAKANPFRFSTKYQDDETDLLYYGYRYYKPSTGDWLSHDPIDEPGFALLQGSGTSNDDAVEYDLEDLDSDGDPADSDGNYSGAR